MLNNFPVILHAALSRKSEIVVPLVHNGLTQLILDIDSDELNAFDQIDQNYLELVVAAIARQISATLTTSV
jgi:L-methionine (R)-S-oxide reductase